MEALAGVFCALWTPTDQRGEILWPALDQHLAFVLESGVSGIMALGSTGEFIHLSLVQRKQVMERIVSSCKGRGRRVIANVSDAAYRNVIELGRHARAIGADCLSVLPPWYFPFSERDLTEFFRGVARETQAPLALYNYPEVTGKKLSIDLIRTIAGEANIVALKQSGSEFAYHTELLALGQELNIPVLTGADTRLEQALHLGCSGTISGLANAAPELFLALYENFRAGKGVEKETGLVAELEKQIQTLTFPLNVKAAIAARGFETGELKAPASRETCDNYERVVTALAGWFKAHCEPPVTMA
jgi:dihydrodipicolinate synthase/N-acetylneuraminate lyase